MTIKKTISILSILVFSNCLFAQQKGAMLLGTVMDKSSKQAIEFANVQLLKSVDSSIVKTTVSDEKGHFSLDNINVGDYLFQCSFIGYSVVSKPIRITGSEKTDLGNIDIVSTAKNLDEVVIATQKATLNTSIDRKVYNVTQDIMAQSGTASDVLKNIPSVEVDIDGNVSLRGSTEVMILINGRPSPMMGKTRAEVLQQFPANTIERIEVITNPSARFRPDGTSGIINIVLKKIPKVVGMVLQH